MKRDRIEYISPKNLKPYENNPRRNDGAVEAVAKSIETFGFRVPIVVDRDNVIIAGHTRLKAAERLGLEEVPIIRADDLTEEQVKAYRIADNSTAELAEWDMDKLEIELGDLTIDMEDFGIEIPEDRHDEWKKKTWDLYGAIENLDTAQYTGSGKYDIPEIAPVYELPPIKEWIGFHYVLSDKNPEGKAVHFFESDYLFERLWRNPERYLEKLQQYECVASPDFSPYGDMPLALQIYNHYRKHWIGHWLQENGVTVIPTIRASTDPRSLEWYLDGEPHGGIVLMSSMWSTKYPEEAKDEYRRMKQALRPKKVIIYGHKADMGIDPKDNVEYINSFSEKRFRKETEAE